MPNSKEKLIQSTLALYLDHGLSGVSMRKVASKAGLSTMATYRHFESKEHLLNEMVMEGFKSLQSYFIQARSVENAGASLRLCMQLYIEFAQKQPEFYEMMFLARLRSEDPLLEERCHQQFELALKFLSERVKLCIDRGALKPQDPHNFALSLWSLCHGMISLQILGKLNINEEFLSFYQSTLDRFFSQARLA